MKIFERSLWLVAGVVAGWLVAVPTIEYTKMLFEYFNIPMWGMALLGVYLTFAVKFKNVFWIFNYIKRFMR